METNNNRKYMLIAQTEETCFEINWTSIKGFEHLQNEKYKLHFIDMFTKNFKNKNELISKLLKNNLIFDDSSIKICILPFTTQYDECISNQKTLVGEVVFKQTYELIYNVNNIMSILLKLINEADFCTLLRNFYIDNGDYYESNILRMQAEINEFEKIKTKQAFNDTLFKECLELNQKLNNIEACYKALNNIFNYNFHINNTSYCFSEEEITSIKRSVYEFIIRQKYNVLYFEDIGIFTAEKNENELNKINYEQIHNLCMLIQEYIIEKNNNLLVQNKIYQKTNKEAI